MKQKPKSTKPPAAESIAKRADKGENILRFYKGEGRMVQPASAKP